MAFKIHGKVIEKETGKGVPNLIVKAIDKDLLFDDLLGAVITDMNGDFEIKYDKEDFQELFFDKKPDIYLKIKTPDGNVIHSTEDKVRYEAGETEEFNIKISKNKIKNLDKIQKMEWNIKKSDKLKEKIAKDEELMRELSKSTDEVLKKHGVELKGMSYVFEPRVFTMDRSEVPEVVMNARKAAAIASIENMYRVDDSVIVDIGGLAGPYDSWVLSELEKYRISDKKFELSDSNPLPAKEALIKQIVGNKELLGELSGAIFGILKEHGINFEKNEGCVFIPFVFETPIFAQKVGVVKELQQIRGFVPQIYADPHPDPWHKLKKIPYPGIIETEWGYAPGVIIEDQLQVSWKWEIGIPDPEMLLALDRIREYR